MRLVNGARILVGVWVILSCGVFVLMLNGFKPYQALILLLGSRRRCPSPI